MYPQQAMMEVTLAGCQSGQPLQDWLWAATAAAKEKAFGLRTCVARGKTRSVRVKSLAEVRRKPTYLRRVRRVGPRENLTVPSMDQGRSLRQGEAPVNMAGML